MKIEKNVIQPQTEQPAAPAPDASADARHRSRPARVPGRHRASRPAQAPLPTPDQPFLRPSNPTTDDPFSSQPSIYDPDADFIVDSAASEIRELLIPEPDVKPAPDVKPEPDEPPPVP